MLKNKIADLEADLEVQPTLLYMYLINVKKKYNLRGCKVDFKRNTVPADISCLIHDYCQELTFSLLYYLKIGRKNRQK